MKNGDSIIWDSNFGYEFGIFKSKKGVMYNTVLVDLKTGIMGGLISLSKDKVYPYTDKLANQLAKKYKFSKTF